MTPNPTRSIEKRGGYVKQRVIGAIIYALVALATANWIEYGLWSGQPYGHQGPMRVALAGTAAFAISIFLSLLRSRFELLFGVVGIGLSWPYFGLLAADLPWKDVVWLVRIHVHGLDQVAAILFLIVATIYVLKRGWTWPARYAPR